MQPAPRRCSSIAYSRYAHSSRRRRAARGVDLGPEGGTLILVRVLSGGDRRGSALLVTLLIGVLLSGLAGALVVVLSTEEAVEVNHRRGVVALYAADGLLADVVAELAAVPDWRAVLGGSRRSTFSTGPIRVPLGDGSVINLRQETLDLQRALERAGAPGVTPQWRLYAWGWFADLVHETDPGRLVYVAAWVRDDLADPDADPGQDTNGRVVVRAAAFGSFRTRRAVDAAVGRESGSLSVVTWGLVR